MKIDVQSGTSEKQDWYKDNQLSETEYKRLLEEKLKRVMTYKVVYPVRKK